MTIKKQLGLALMIVTVLLSVACGNKLIRGATPIVRMNELSHDGDNINLLLSIKHIKNTSFFSMFRTFIFK